MLHRNLIVGVSALLLGACATGEGYYERDYDQQGYYDSQNDDRGYADDRRSHDPRYVERYDDRRDADARYEQPGYSNCSDCGRVERIERLDRGDGHTSGGGAVAGAVVGGAVGNQFGHGDGRAAATVAGAVVGGIVGNNIERNSSHDDHFRLAVQMDNGRRVLIAQNELYGIREGSRVVIRGGRARLL